MKMGLRSLSEFFSSSPRTEPEQTRASTKSLPVSIFEEQIENGRTYTNDTYFLPNDDAEETRISITHQAYFLILTGQLTMSHLRENTRRVLDVGSGPGDWAIAMGERLPQAEIIATDICPYEPLDVPQNVSFQIDNATEEWTYTQPFDLIHMRGLTGAFQDWKFVYGQAFKHLANDGVLEIADWGPIRLPNTSDDSYLSIFNSACQSAAEKAGYGFGLEHLRKAEVESAGFSVMKSISMEVPLGTWSPDPRKRGLGKMAMIAMLEGLEAQSLRRLTKELEWKAEDVKDICNKVKEELMKAEARASVICQFVVARKIMTAG